MKDKKQHNVSFTINTKLLYSRALQSVIWGIPAVNFNAMYQAFLSAGGIHNQIAYSSQPGNWKNQRLTPNPDAIFALAFYNTMISGPMVLQIPEAAEFSIVGTIFSCWQLPLEDVGPLGRDQGKGAQYLILPPDYKETVPSEYVVLSAPNYQGYALLRCLPKSDKEADIAEAVGYIKQIELFPLSSENEDHPTNYIDLTAVHFEAAIPYDITFFESLNAIVQQEPWLERDMIMVDVLKGIGIEKNKPFSPSPELRKILHDAAADGKEFLEQKYASFVPFYTDSKWFFPADAALLNSWMSGFKQIESYPIEARAGVYFRGYGSLKRTEAEISQFHLFLIHDHNRNDLDGSKVYKLTIPANVPVNNYWSVTVYNRETHTFIKEMTHSSRSSLNQDLIIDKDGTVTIYFAPSFPEQENTNWIPTKRDEKFEIIFRFNGVEKELLEKKWKLPDLEIELI